MQNQDPSIEGFCLCLKATGILFTNLVIFSMNITKKGGKSNG